MATATSITTNNDVPSNYHTVIIDANLPKIEKYYSIENIKDLPPIDYWLNKMGQEVDKACYKVQHIIANGPCQCRQFFFC
jgi:pantothenate kinase